MAKNIKNNSIVKIQRFINEPHIPYISDNKLDHAMYELRKSQNNVLDYKKYLIVSIIINIILGVYICKI